LFLLFNKVVAKLLYALKLFGGVNVMPVPEADQLVW